MTTMDSLDMLGAEEIGFDWFSMVKGGANALSNLGSPKTDSKAIEMERLRLEEERRRAEQSAMQMKLFAGLAGVVAVGLGIALIARK